MSQIALQMYTLRRHMNDLAQLKETLRRVAEIGYKNVQISVPDYMSVEELQSELERNGLAADSVFAPSMKITGMVNEITHSAQILRTDVVRTDSIPQEWAGSPQGYRDYAKVLDEAGSALASRGLKFYYHFHAFEWINFEDGVRGIDILLNDTNPETVGFQPDVFWLTAAGTEPSSSLALFRGRARYMHVKDYAIVRRTGILESVPRAFAPVGLGNLNWNGLIPAAKDAGIERFVVEQDECEGDEFEAIRTSLENLHRMGIY